MTDANSCVLLALNMPFAHTLLRTRRERSLTQTQVAHGAGINISTVVHLERGHHRRPPQRDTLERIAAVFALPVTELFPEFTIRDEVAA